MQPQRHHRTNDWEMWIFLNRSHRLYIFRAFKPKTTVSGKNPQHIHLLTYLKPKSEWNSSRTNLINVSKSKKRKRREKKKTQWLPHPWHIHPFLLHALSFHFFLSGPPRASSLTSIQGKNQKRTVRETYLIRTRRAQSCTKKNTTNILYLKMEWEKEKWFGGGEIER